MSASSLSPTSKAPTPDLPGPNLRFAELASEERIDATVAALRQNGVHTTVVSTRAEAVEAVLGLVPEGAEVLDAPSQTLAALGLDAALADRPRFRNVRAELMRLRQENQPDAQRKLGASPEVIVGSVHAITEKGQIVVASATGSQLGPYVSGAGKVIWVAGTQKIVPDLDTAFQRIQEYTLPRETERALKAYGFPSFVGKLLIINRETNPGRLHLILIRENLGF
jgi:L-lactate utilization protein LutC